MTNEKQITEKDLVLEYLMSETERSMENVQSEIERFRTYLWLNASEGNDPTKEDFSDFDDEVMAIMSKVLNDIEDMKSGMDVLTCDRMNGSGEIYERESAKTQSTVH